MTEGDDYRLERARVRGRFNASAARYDTVAVLQREVADRLLERLEPLLIRPRRVLDLGAGTGYASRELLRRYRKAEVYALDASAQMLRRARQRPPWRRKPHCACADLHALPFPDDSFELVFSNVALQWAEDLGKALAELQRVTAPEGAVMFSTFGPETLYELRTAWAEVDGYPHVHRFVDKHDIGDRMLEAGLVDPVVDGELFTLTYDQPREVMRDLKALGAANAAAGRARGLVSPHRLARVEAAYSLAFRQPGGRVPATYEVVYGHAWGRAGRPQRVDDTGAVHIDAAQIRRRR